MSRRGPGRDGKSPALLGLRTGIIPGIERYISFRILVTGGGGPPAEGLLQTNIRLGGTVLKLGSSSE